MRPTLHTERLALRPLSDTDLDDLVAMNGDPEVMAYLSRPLTRGQVADQLPGWVSGDGDFGLWAGRTAPEDDAFAGVWFLSRDADDPTAGEIGWRLPRHAWGHGYAVEGAQAIIGHAFDTLGLERLRAETMAVNTRSRRVMERLGMTHVTSWREEFDDPLPGTEHGEVGYELTSSRRGPSPDADPSRSGRAPA